MYSRMLVGGIFAASLCCSLSIAKAQQFQDVISFGDSLSDSGNAFALSGGTTPPSPPYFDGRFSNGPVWVELLGGPMQNLFAPGLPLPPDGNINAAVGGAWSVSTPASLVPDVPDQLSVFKALGGTIGENDLVTLWAGANNLLNGAPIDTAAAGQVANLDRLVGPEFGARHVLIANLPPLPGFPIATNPSLVFNQALDAGTQAVAAAHPDANIVQMDVFSAFTVIVTSPRAFGLTEISAPCLSGGTICANPDQHLFWDAVHPTRVGHQALALFAGLLLSTGENSLAIAPLAETAFYSRLDASSAAFDRTIDAIAFPNEWRSGLYAEVIGSRLDQDAQGNVPSYSQDLAGVRIGAANRFGPAIAGVSFAYLEGDHDQAGLSTDVTTVHGDAYGVVDMKSFFINAAGGFTSTSFDDISRFTGFPTVSASSETDAWSFSGAIGAGLKLDLGGFKLIPNARVGYLSSEVDAFSERAPVLALSFADREISSGYWSAGLRAAAELGGHHALKAYAEVGYESLFSTQTDDITARLVNNTALPATTEIDDSASRGFYVRLGASGNIASDMSLGVDYGLSLQDGEGESHTARVQIKKLFGGGLEALE
jgi:outer membrane lipase/esterase